MQKSLGFTKIVEYDDAQVSTTSGTVSMKNATIYGEKALRGARKSDRSVAVGRLIVFLAYVLFFHSTRESRGEKSVNSNELRFNV